MLITFREHRHLIDLTFIVIVFKSFNHIFGNIIMSAHCDIRGRKFNNKSHSKIDICIYVRFYQLHRPKTNAFLINLRVLFEKKKGIKTGHLIIFDR